MRNPTKTITLTNAKTGDHEEMSYSDAAHRLGTNVAHVVKLLGDDGIGEFTCYPLTPIKYYLREIPQ